MLAEQIIPWMFLLAARALALQEQIWHQVRPAGRNLTWLRGLGMQRYDPTEDSSDGSSSSPSLAKQYALTPIGELPILPPGYSRIVDYHDAPLYTVVSPPNKLWFCPMLHDGPGGQVERMIYSITLALEYNISACIHAIKPHGPTADDMQDFIPICKVLRCDSPAIKAVAFDGSQLPRDTMATNCNDADIDCFQTSIAQNLPVVVGGSSAFRQWVNPSRVYSLGPSLFKQQLHVKSSLSNHTCVHLRISDFVFHKDLLQLTIGDLLDFRQNQALNESSGGQNFMSMSISDGLNKLREIVGRPLYIMTPRPDIVGDPQMLTLLSFDLDARDESAAHLDRVICSQCGNFIKADHSQFSNVVMIMRGTADALTLSSVVG